jgi:hypothetical protein
LALTVSPYPILVRFTLVALPLENRTQADVARLVEKPIRNAVSLAYVVVEYGGLRVVLGGSRVSRSMFCTAFCNSNLNSRFHVGWSLVVHSLAHSELRVSAHRKSIFCSPLLRWRGSPRSKFSARKALSSPSPRRSTACIFCGAAGKPGHSDRLWAALDPGRRNTFSTGRRSEWLLAKRPVSCGGIHEHYRAH